MMLPNRDMLLGVAAMRKRHSVDENPHVDRDYLRPDEANAVIEAAGRIGR
jgi:hypothetical protein